MAAVLTGWRTRQTVIDRNISVELECYFRVISQFFSRISCIFECRYLINGNRRITAHMTSWLILYRKKCVCWTLCGSFCNGELYEIKLRIIQNDGRVSVSVMRLTTAIVECFDLPQQPEKLAAAFPYEQFIQCLCKITKITTTINHILKLKCTKFDFNRGSRSAPDPAEDLTALPSPLTGFKGDYF